MKAVHRSCVHISETMAGVFAGAVSRLTRYPTAEQIMVPVKTYHVQARDVFSQTNSITASATAIPVMTPRWFARFVKTPSRKAPSIAPYGSDAMVKAVLRTDFVKLFEAIAIKINITPQPTVNQRDNRSK